ncbi:MATE family efflux transporter [Bengtsoniella intestinalis]|uniref:MATE family efflux transporter n=1 Tax=Bengtsoniella intestinalis TaxID=3073143 RepID=UPI00391FA6BF
MSQSPQRENKIGTAPIFPLILKMGLPLMISMLIQAMYNLVDSVFVSMVSENAFTAVSLAFPLQNLMIAVAAGTGVGVAALTSRHLGEGNHHSALVVARQGLFLAFCGSVVFAIIGLFAMDAFFGFQTSDPEILTYGIQYGSICCMVSMGLNFGITCERLLQATGRTMLSMCVQGVGAIVNIILDPILIFGLLGFPAMGVAGAAIATVTGQVCSMILGLYFCLRKNPELPLTAKGFHPQLPVIRRIYIIGIPAIIAQGIGSVMVYAMNFILIGFTSTATAVFGAYFKLMSFASMPVFGLNNAIIPVVGYNYGAKKPERIGQAFRAGWTIASCFLGLGCFAFMVFPTQLLGFFSPSDYMLSIGVPALRIMSLSFIPAAFCISCMALFQGLGKAMYSTTCSAVRQLVVLVPVAYLLSLSGDLGLVWWAIPIAEIFSIACAVFFLNRVWKKFVVPAA